MLAYYIHIASADHMPMKADWAHVFLSVLPALPLSAAKDENRIALALKAACAGTMARSVSALNLLLSSLSQILVHSVTAQI